MPFVPAAVRFLAAFLLASFARGADEPVEMMDRGDELLLRNGIVEATLHKRTSTIRSMKLGRHELVSPRKPIYYSMGGGKAYRQPTGAAFRVVSQTPDLIDVAFLQKWTPGAPQAVDIEVHYALHRGESGIHTYAILSHPADYPDSSVGEWRMVWGMPAENDRHWLMEKIRVDPLRSWEMPSPADLAAAKPTGIKEIVEITRGPRAGEFDCKYDFNLEYHTVGCWGHASDRNKVGAWIVLASHEFFNDGPTKQDLSSASGLIHIHFGMNHYNGSGTKLRAGEEWRKIYGPYLLYGNQGGDAGQLWDDARGKAAAERRKWPYAWVADDALYPKRAGRGEVSGKLVVCDPLKPALSPEGAWVGLSRPEPDGNWQMESNHYQYWSKVRKGGTFTIPHVRPGSYTFSAFLDGAVGEFELQGAVVKAGENDAGTIEWDIPRKGRSIAWEIGVPDRRAGEFRLGNDYFHGYVWTGFSKDLRNPLVYEIGKSDPSRDWNFAQGAYMKRGRCERWPWEIRFGLDEVAREGDARLTIAWASADNARVNVEVNGEGVASILPAFSGGNALLREGIHAKYSFNHIDFPASLLRKGRNTVTLTQTRTSGPACHVMYDYLALELP